jgi:hypothetical protein
MAGDDDDKGLYNKLLPNQRVYGGKGSAAKSDNIKHSNTKNIERRTRKPRPGECHADNPCCRNAPNRQTVTGFRDEDELDSDKEDELDSDKKDKLDSDKKRERRHFLKISADFENTWREGQMNRLAGN